MMACFIDRIFSISVMLPYLIRQKLELIVVVPIIKTTIRNMTITLYLLKEYHISIYLP